MKQNTRKGFTLAELLVVVAIIGVLVAIAIPTFTAQLEKARIATDDANIRAAYAMYKAAVLQDEITYVDSSTKQTVTVKPTGSGKKTYYCLTPGGDLSLTMTGSGLYQLKADHPGCQIGGENFTHTKGHYIAVTCTLDAAGNRTWSFGSTASVSSDGKGS